MADIDYSPEIIGKSPAILSIKEFIRKAADSQLPVLIEGASGTGKELVAAAIHKNGARASQPFIAINCGAMPKDLLENELFGHEAGAFTGATSLKRGLFEVANGGTLFIDEIGEMEITSQSKLLRVLESKAFRRLGSTKEIKTDVRIIAATNKVLETQIAKNEFRSDLYYRLSVLRTFLPLLKNRISDLRLLIDHICDRLQATEKPAKPVKKISPEAMQVFQNYDWPGNVRELINVLSRAHVVVSGDEMTIKDIPESMIRKAAAAASVDLEEMTLDEFICGKEAEFIKAMLEKYTHDKERTAKALDISRAQFYRKLKKYRLG